MFDEQELRAMDTDSLIEKVEELEAKARAAERETEQVKESLVEKVEELEAEARAAERETELIADIHQSLLPDDPPTIMGLTIAMSHVAPNRAGGDYYDFIPMRRLENMEPDPDGRWLLVVADASGHGPAAAMIMAMIQAVLHAYSGADQDPGDVLGFVNKQMAVKKIEGSFTTAFLGIVDPAQRMLWYSTAGHHPPLLRSPDGTVRDLDCERGGPPLAVDPDSEFGTHEHAFQSGEFILIYTDGAVEAMCPDGNEFSIPRLRQAVADASGEPRETLVRVNLAIRAHRDGEAQTDDKTLVGIRFD